MYFPLNTIITRVQLEDAIQARIPNQQRPNPNAPVWIHTLYEEDNQVRKELVFEWIPFFGGATRTYPNPSEWNTGVVQQLRDAKEFIREFRKTSNLCVTGSRRLSAALALGSVFSATSGFNVAMEHRDKVFWYTNDHSGTEDAVSLSITFPQRKGDELIVAIGIPNDIRSAVENYVTAQGASHLPFLNIAFTQPVTNSRQANAIIGQIKKAILQTLTDSQARQIHLFCAVPSFIALFLGHRLNATAPVQCYEYVPPSTYVPTCILSP